MTSSSSNQFSMEYIEVENEEGMRWRIDNNINGNFDEWVSFSSPWFTLNRQTIQVAVRYQTQEPGK